MEHFTAKSGEWQGHTITLWPNANNDLNEINYSVSDVFTCTPLFATKEELDSWR